MEQPVASIRPFIGAKNFEVSRRFYRDWGFEETELDGMCVFKMAEFRFYLQNAYVKDWIDNTMVFLEVNNIDDYYASLEKLDLPGKYEGVKLVPIRKEYWGRIFFLHDPSGVAWLIGEFSR